MIEGFRVQNYRSLKDVTFGRLWNVQKDPLTPLAVVIGKNGVGKSTLFDAFGFVADALIVGVEEACERNTRGGFMRLRSSGIEANIRFEIYYRESAASRPMTYELEVGLDTLRLMKESMWKRNNEVFIIKEFGVICTDSVAVLIG